MAQEAPARQGRQEAEDVIDADQAKRPEQTSPAALVSGLLGALDANLRAKVVLQPVGARPVQRLAAACFAFGWLLGAFLARWAAPDDSSACCLQHHVASLDFDRAASEMQRAQMRMQEPGHGGGGHYGFIGPALARPSRRRPDSRAAARVSLYCPPTPAAARRDDPRYGLDRRR